MKESRRRNKSVPEEKVNDVMVELAIYYPVLCLCGFREIPSHSFVMDAASHMPDCGSFAFTAQIT